MKCRDIEPLLYLVREGELTAEEERIVAGHIAICSNCRMIYESARKMTGLVSQASFEYNNSGNSKVLFENIIREIDKTKFGNPGTFFFRYNYIIRGIAASLILLIATTLIYQEADFYRHRSAVNIPIQKEENYSAIDVRETDCLKALKRKYKVRAFFTGPHEDLVMNRISQEQLTQYIEQACGSGTGDISKVKKMLIQSGVIKMIQEN